MKILDNKVVVLSGSSSGVGAAAAKLFAQEGAKLVLCARRADRLEQVVAEVKALGGEVIGIVADVSKQEDVENVFAKAIEAFGRVDVLVNNAAITDNLNGIMKTNDDWINGTFSVNAMGTLRMTREALKYMLPAGKGNIVNTSSAGAYRGQGGAGYCMSKGAVSALTRHVAVRYMREGIRCNAVCPGGINTPMTTELPYNICDMEMAAAMDCHNVRKNPICTGEEIANVLLFLASDLSSALNGQWVNACHGDDL